MWKSTLFLGLVVLGLAAASGPLPAASPLYPPARPPFIELTREGTARAVVVVTDDAPREMRRAAEELAAYVQRISGAKLEIAAKPGDGAAVVLEVDPELHPRPAGQRDWPGARGYRLRTEGQRLQVTGADPLGVLHGVYGLLERHLGVRWLWPGELGEIVPRQKTLRVGTLDEASIPDFAVRWVGGGDWALRHGANAMVEIGKQPVGVKWKWHFHTFCTLIPAEKYYDAHPDWWPLVKGQRKRPDQPHSHSTQLCTSNAEMVAEMTRNLIAVLDQEPDTDIIALSPNDGGGFCECDHCRALDEPGRDWFARYSKRLAVLNNTVAREVAKRHPRVLIKVGAYAMYLRRPLDPALAPTANQLVQICHIYNCHNHPVPGARCVEGQTFTASSDFLPNAVFRQIIDDWKKVTDHLFVYEYYTLGGPSKAGLPWPLVHTIRADMPYYHRVGAEGFYTQLTESMFHRYGVNYYVAAKLAWNVSLDVDALLADYAGHAFGPAAEPMLAYFGRLERAMTDADCCLSYGLESPQRWGPRVFTGEVMAQAAALLAQATAAAPAGPHRERIAFFQKGFDEAREGLAKMNPRK
ncbi:MAG: DUF4838 domain-containing protein [Candidatus Anammoximicrobium sp.]|nr:DUF4838 domain-containing protein [Candidatus Anammoximicrobium sp.]